MIRARIADNRSMNTRTQRTGTMKRLLTLTAALVFSAPAVASAGLVVHTTDPVAKAAAVATAYWGAAPCGGSYPIVYGAPASSDINAGPINTAIANGQMLIQAWANPTDPTCTIHLNPVFWTQATETAQFQTFCDVITHEIGHFLGHE